jgi:hypothetical protein
VEELSTVAEPGARLDDVQLMMLVLSSWKFSVVIIWRIKHALEVIYQIGQEVLALDFKRESHRVRVWSENETSIFVASEEVFTALERGGRDQWPVAVPKEDVYPLGSESRFKAKPKN